jgi:hypothetical protein
VITVRVGGSRLNFQEATSYDYVRWNTLAGTGTADYNALTLFDAEGNAVATFYKWDGVDAGEAP